MTSLNHCKRLLLVNPPDRQVWFPIGWICAMTSLNHCKRLLLVNPPDRQVPILASSYPVFLIEQGDAVYTGLRPIEHQLALLHNLPDTRAAVATSGSHTTFTASSVKSANLVLVTKKSFDISSFIHGPDFHAP